MAQKTTHVSVDPETLPYRPCVGIMVLSPTNQVWVGHRFDTPKDTEGAGTWWQMPQGGIDTGEESRAAALRELYEETSIRSVEIVAETADWLTYDLPSELIGVAWKGRFRGQKQKWYAARFLGSDDEIDILTPGGGTHKPEFDAWKWAPMAELTGLIIPFKRAVYETLISEFGHLASQP
ncbi:MAG: RNA pyrophosphohydrolase [Pseudomonadota bacterium]